MNYKDAYNNIIDVIEENICEDVDTIYKKVKQLGASKRNIASIFKFISGMEFAPYIKERKICRIAQSKITDENEKPWVDIASDYSIYEYSTFNRLFKSFLGVNPGDFPEKYEGDIWEKKPAYLSDEVEKETFLIEVESDPIYIPCDEYHDTQDLITEFILNDGGSEQMADIIRNATGLKNTFSSEEEMENFITSEVNNNPEAKNLLETYKTVIELEDCRAMYGFSIDEILCLYLKNNCNSENLHQECERICDEEIARRVEEFEEEPDYDEWEEEFYNDEMRYSEAYEYYQGEDEMEYESEEGFNNNSIKHMYW